MNNNGMRDSLSSGNLPGGIEWCFVALKKYAVFTGRARPKEFWMFLLFYIVTDIILFILIENLFDISFEYDSDNPIFYLFGLSMALPGIGVTIRRMHDTNRSGWFGFIPLANLVWACEKGTVGPNQYGPDPMQSQGA
jgi:uncharacterized membrane protein YhaH (DUF805 family)